MIARHRGTHLLDYLSPGIQGQLELSLETLSLKVKHSALLPHTELCISYLSDSWVEILFFITFQGVLKIAEHPHLECVLRAAHTGFREITPSTDCIHSSCS